MGPEALSKTSLWTKVHGTTRQARLTPISELLTATTLPARAGGDLAAGPSLIAQKHGGALLAGGKPGHPGTNHHMGRERAQAVRGELVAELEGAAKDLAAILETARESDGDRLPTTEGPLAPAIWGLGPLPAPALM